MSVDLNTVRVEWAYPDYDSDLPDPRGEGGGVGWTIPEGGSTYRRSEYVIPSLEYTVSGKPGPYMVVDTTGTTVGIWSRRVHPYRTEIEMEIGRTSTSPQVTLNVDFLTAAGNNVTMMYDTNVTNIRTTTNTGWTRLYAKGIATGTGAVAVRYSLSGTGVYAVRNIKVTESAINGIPSRDDYFFTQPGYSVPSLATRALWTNVTSAVQAISIKRGCRPNPPVDQLEIGTATIRFKTAPVNSAAATYGPIRPGYRVRISGWNGTEWESVFEGRLSELVPVAAVGDAPGYMEWRLQDRVADVATRDSVGIRGTGPSEQLESILNPQPNAYLYNPAVRVTNEFTYLHGTEAYVMDQQANRLDSMLTIRNTDQGLLWCDRVNQLQYVSGATAIPNVRGRSTLVFRHTNPGAGEKSPVLAGWDREQDNAYKLNQLNITRIYIDGSLTGTQSHTSRWVYSGDAMVYGRRQASYSYISTDANTPQTRTRDLVYAFGATSYALDQFQFNATKDVATAAKVDVYDNVQVFTSNSSLATDYRIIGLEHDIRPGSWLVKFIVRPKERRYTGTPAVTLPDFDGGTI